MVVESRGRPGAGVQENRAHSLGVLQSLEPAIRVWTAPGVTLLQHRSHLWQVNHDSPAPHPCSVVTPTLPQAPGGNQHSPPGDISGSHRLVGVQTGKKAPKEMTSLWGDSQTITEVRLWGEWTTGCPSLILSRSGHIRFKGSPSACD